MARKKYTPATLKRKIDQYFDAIITERPMLEKVPMIQDRDGVMVPVLDSYGHQSWEFRPVIARNGQPVTELIYTSPPSIVGLCLFLGVDRATFFRWTKAGENGAASEEELKICNIATHARGRIEEYLIAQTQNPKAARGAIANLEANFGWKQRKEIGLDEPTRKAEAAKMLTLEEKRAALVEMGILPGEDPEK